MDPWLQQALIGLLALLVGLGFVFYGFGLFLVLLPIWGFFVGFLFGANLVHWFFGENLPFLATTSGWVVGFFAGLLFAALSYLYYWFAVVFIGASIGYMAALGVLAWLGNGGDNLVGFIVGLIGAVIGAAIVVVLRLPKYLVILLTAIGGAFAAIAGLALIFDRLKLSQMDGGLLGAFRAVQDLNWLWPVAAVVVAIIGIVYQMRITGAQEAIMMESYRNPGMPPSGSSRY